jgi:hypothetical protein
LLRRAQRARRAARFLSSLTVIVGMVIRRHDHRALASPAENSLARFEAV